MFSLLGILAFTTSALASCDEAVFIASQKEGRAEIIASMEANLNRVELLLQQRSAVRARMLELDTMSPAKRRLKSAFNGEYDWRVLEGRDERLRLGIDGIKDELTFAESKNRGLDMQLKEFALRCTAR